MDLRPVQEAILAIYSTFAALCDRHGLRYWVGYGTLLGAVRHKGFIPWDDDFDLLMPRSDFNRLWPILEKELPSHLAVVTWRNAPAFCDLFGKVVLTRTNEVAKIEAVAGTSLPEGVFIDVFAVDGAPTGAWGWCRSHASSFGHHLLYALARGVVGAGRGSLRRRYLEGCERRAQARPFIGSKVCARFTANRHAFAWRCPTAVFADTTWLPFEGIEVPAPIGYDTFLRVNYGDYMCLPPEKDRRPRHKGPPVAWRLGGERG